MKRAMIIALALIGLVAMPVCVSGQIVPGQVGYRKGEFYNSNGEKLDRQAVLYYFGEDIFQETYVGAKKQFNAGRNLVNAGIGGIAGGLALAVVAGATADSDGGYTLALVGAYLCSMAGSACLNAGIPLKVIGSKRMEWMAEDYNTRMGFTRRPGERFRPSIGASTHGIGLALNF